MAVRHLLLALAGLTPNGCATGSARDLHEGRCAFFCCAGDYRCGCVGAKPYAAHYIVSVLGERVLLCVLVGIVAEAAKLMSKEDTTDEIQRLKAPQRSFVILTCTMRSLHRLGGIANHEGHRHPCNL